MRIIIREWTKVRLLFESSLRYHELDNQINLSSLKWHVALVDLANNFVQSQRLRYPGPPQVVKHKDCSKIHYDYTDQKTGLKLLVTRFTISRTNHRGILLSRRRRDELKWWL